ncbi:venom allergen 5-like [Asbolus verrucosus]|uniref:Venom allergen 5-like n=1 Tax=Asbolus verrucosus TaxID=1661398 RepID=A0A482VC49_ASBVE|nr:venom allergen 5-like [Asbolus verrucosus]
MKQTLLLCCWFGLQTTVKSHEIDPTQFDYCSLYCKVGTHTACPCKELGEGRTEIFDNIAAFRRTVVEEHNRLRNKIAGGGERVRGFPFAADMMTINYDLELEYIAICHGKEFFGFHDECRRPHNSNDSGQNLFGVSDKNDTPAFYKMAIGVWYDEIEFVADPENLVESYHPKKHSKEGKTIEHFTQLVWSTTTRIGCTRLWFPNNPKNATFRFSIICNYAGGEGANMISRPVYLSGESCSRCPPGATCNDRYMNLCGEIEPIPTDEPFNKDGEGGGGGGGGDGSGVNRVYINRTLLIIAILICLN